MEAKDRFGRDVKLGDRVRIVGFSKRFMDSLPPDEFAQISEMIGDEFEVEEINEVGWALVTKWWHHDDGTSDAHDISLESSEMELVTAGGIKGSPDGVV